MLIAGDYAPARYQSVINLNTDLLLLNLEGPVHKDEPPLEQLDFCQSQKSGPLLFSRAFPKFDGDILYCLANNHFMDLGHEVCDRNLLEIAGLGNQFVGYGINSATARRPKVLKYQDTLIGVISVSENQFGGSSEGIPGIATLGPWVHKAVSDLAASVDYVIVMVHAGAEDVPVPLPYFVDLYRQFISDGANLVVNTHPHLPQGHEEYMEGHIFYGLGNFIVDPSLWGNNPLATTSIVVSLNFNSGVPCVEYFPVQIKKNDNIISLNLKCNLKVFSDYMELCCRFISSQEKLNAYWKFIGPKLFKNYLAQYLTAFSLKADIKWRIKQLLKFILPGKVSLKEHQFLSRNRMLSMHAIQCETHRELAVLALTLPSEKEEKVDALVETLIRVSPYRID
jgi:poly-gamma-glutamate synthesis protein (capsule biosynthesis protein)